MCRGFSWCIFLRSYVLLYCRCQSKRLCITLNPSLLRDPERSLMSTANLCRPLNLLYIKANCGSLKHSSKLGSGSFCVFNRRSSYHLDMYFPCNYILHVACWASTYKESRRGMACGYIPDSICSIILHIRHIRANHKSISKSVYACYPLPSQKNYNLGFR